MQSMFDERLWLAWLAKVRIIILTLLFGIELAIARLTPNPLPLRLFINVILSVVHHFASSTCSCFFLGGAPHPGPAAGRHRPGAGHTGGLCHRRCGQFAEFPLPAGHHRCLHSVAAGLGVPDRGAGFHPVCAVLELTYFEVIPSYSTTHPGLGALAGDHFRQSLRLSGGGVPGGIAGGQAAPGGRKAESIPAARWKTFRPCTKILFSPSPAA